MCVASCFLSCLAKASVGKLTPDKGSRLLHLWSARLLRGIGARLTISGVPPAHGLIVSNHLSYLDIFAFSAVAPCAFVSKDEIRSWPIIGRIASLAGCVFIDRADRSQAHLVQPQMKAALANGARLILFPEGTSSDGSNVLPFHSSLLEPAVAMQLPVAIAHISYSLSDGDPATEACYWGEMKMLPHAIRLLSKQRLEINLRFANQGQAFSSRKEAARQLREQIQDMGQASSTSV